MKRVNYLVVFLVAVLLLLLAVSACAPAEAPPEAQAPEPTTEAVSEPAEEAAEEPAESAGAGVCGTAEEVTITYIGDPAGERQTLLLNGLHTEQRMVQTAQTHAHHQHHGQIQSMRQIGHGRPAVEGYLPASHPLYYHALGFACQVLIDPHDPPYIDFHTGLPGGQMGSYGRCKGIWVY